MIWPVQEMARVFAQMQQSIASGERVFSLLDAVPEVMDKPGAGDGAPGGRHRLRERDLLL
jgi:ATP-binding cassette subfamily B protein